MTPRGTAAGGARGAGRWLVSRVYARLWAGQAVSSLGDAVFTVAAVLWVDRDLAAGRAWAAAAVSGVPCAAYAAVALAGPLAGVAVDRFDRRAVMAATELARAALAGALAAVSFVPAGQLPTGARLAAVYLTVAGLNGAGQFFAPARTAVIAAIVPGHADRVRAAGLAEAAASAAGTVGPLIAAPLTLTAGIGWALTVNAVSYLASWLSVRSLPPSRPSRAGAGLRKEFTAGLRAFTASRYLTVLLSVTVTCQLGTGALTALNVLAVTGDLHGTARTYGVAEALMGAGYIAGAAAAGRLVTAAGSRAVTSAGLFTAAALTAGYALARNVPVGLAILAGYGAAIGVLNTSVAPYLMGSAPGGYLGRVLAVFGPVNHAAAAVSVLTCGWLASGPLRGFRAGTIGPVPLLLLTGATLILTAGIRAAAALPPFPTAAEGPGRPAVMSRDTPANAGMPMKLFQARHDVRHGIGIPTRRREQGRASVQGRPQITHSPAAAGDGSEDRGGGRRGRVPGSERLPVRPADRRPGGRARAGAAGTAAADRVARPARRHAFPGRPIRLDNATARHAGRAVHLLVRVPHFVGTRAEVPCHPVPPLGKVAAPGMPIWIERLRSS